MAQAIWTLEILSDFYSRSQPAGIFHIFARTLLPIPSLLGNGDSALLQIPRHGNRKEQ